MGWYVIIATIPIGVAGLAFRHQIENGARNLYLIGTTLIVLGLVLLAAEKVGKRVRPLDDVRRSDAIWVGIAQAMALVPGTSRSGATITAGLFLGLEREAAARFSFLLSIPAIVLSGLFGLSELINGDRDVSYAALADLDGGGVRRRIRVDRLPAALPGVALDAGLRGLPRRARRARDRPHRWRRDQLSAGGSTTSNSRVRSTSSSTRRTASEGRAMAKVAAGVEAGLTRLEQRAQAGRVHEADRAQVEHDGASCRSRARTPPGGGRRRGRAPPRRRSGRRPGAPRRGRGRCSCSRRSCGRGYQGTVPRPPVSARGGIGHHDPRRGWSAVPEEVRRCPQDAQSTPPSASVSSWSTSRWCAASPVGTPTGANRSTT